jgi:hypothetical protein
MQNPADDGGVCLFEYGGTPLPPPPVHDGEDVMNYTAHSSFDSYIKESDDKNDHANTAMIARCRLGNARKWFEHKGWKELPQTTRGERILQWGAFHAYLASSTNPERSVRNWIGRYAPRVKGAELDRLVAATADAVERGARWSPDESAVTLELGWRDRELLHLWHLGANDDPDYTHGHAERRKKGATYSRRYRASNSTGASRGRPALELSEEERLERRRTQAADRKRAERARKKAAATSETENVTLKSVGDIVLVTNNRTVDNDIGDLTDLSVTEFQSHAPQPPDRESRARQASRRQTPEPVKTVHLEASEYPEIIVNADGTFRWADDDDPEHAPFAGATGATTSQSQRRAP